MLKTFEPSDPVLHSTGFMEAEVQYNLVHFIAGQPNSHKLKSSGDDLVYVHSEGYNPWLWISPELGLLQKKALVQQLAEKVKDQELTGVTGGPEPAKLFAEAYCRLTGKLYHPRMMMEAYHCPQAVQPAGVSGYLLQAGEIHIPLISEYVAAFVRDAFGTETPPESHLPYARSLAEAGSLHLWVVEDTPVSMANLAHMSARHVRINEVFTPQEHRKHGYASAAVAELCAQMLGRGITPMLYADAANPDSNKVYQSVGFVNAGTVADLRFQ
ncbi:GNAT family N-acetyltransferase [Paenibacillus sp. MMS20-IR301]|uniref:GNAT family N-acetyltransferase n=1 Tax=Paenibacillus sp. MMS20-IR301 TaxID=2895946 RepID=UPI0028EC66EB|nr:GNAT family N-acetyltransferase [Paenibacillus sp. MMS20-IR301]WNS44422.1 GNAT family N-acetyltransferase [Paenibacillus sp. MMS20-IR301]